MPRTGLLRLSMLASILVPVAASAETTIVVSSWAPPTHTINANVWPAWAGMVEKATGGRVRVKIEYGLAPPPAQFDIILDGAADATWMFHGYNPGRFVATQLVELPGNTAGAEAVSAAYWQVHERYLSAADEHRGVKLIGLTAHGPGHLHTREPVAALDEVEGLKIRVGGGVSSDIAERLGIIGVNVPAPQVYETVASGVADGVLMPMETKQSFRLAEVAPYTLELPGGFYNGSFAFIMNQDTFDSLSPEDQEALMSVSGIELSKLAGRAWEKADKEGVEFAIGEGNTFTLADEAVIAEFRDRTEDIRQTVIERIDGLGIDAGAALADLQALSAQPD
ncbi:MAG: TRAP transporter substrate-binding protein [Geminicoccaceae bacterium]|nr:TRAP transporter substrate-binding protein [Geminicoccaceae bacterium]